MEYELTKEEKQAIASLRRLAKRWPDTLIPYIIDGDRIFVCKRGVPSSEINEIVEFFTCPCIMLTDVHDDMNYGLD